MWFSSNKRIHNIEITFENGADQAVTVTGAQYFLPQVDDIHIGDMWFQQDGVIYHTDRKTI